jgi:hypothetical protein
LVEGLELHLPPTHTGSTPAVTTRLKILLITLSGSVILFGVVVMRLAHHDPNAYQKGRLVKHFRSGPMDPDQIWSSIRSGRGYTHRALGIAERFGTFVYWERGDFPRYDDLMHTCRGTIREGGAEVVIKTPFVSAFVLSRVKINGVSCLIPAQMTLQDAFANDWILALRDGSEANNPFAIREITLLDEPDFQIEKALIERKEEPQSGPRD